MWSFIIIVDCRASSYRDCTPCRSFYKRTGKVLQSDIRSLFTRKDAGKYRLASSQNQKKFPSAEAWGVIPILLPALLLPVLT